MALQELVSLFRAGKSVDPRLRARVANACREFEMNKTTIASQLKFEIPLDMKLFFRKYTARSRAHR